MASLLLRLGKKSSTRKMFTDVSTKQPLTIQVNANDIWVGVYLLQGVYTTKLEDFGNEWDQRLVLEELDLEGERRRHLIILIFS